MSNGTRNNATEKIPINLYYQFTKGGAVFSIYNFQKVEIYETYADAVAGTNIVQTIDATGDISETTTGKYMYTAGGDETGDWLTYGTYYDKVFIIPELGGIQYTDIGQFCMRAESDETIPFKHGAKLFDVATEPKDFYKIDSSHIMGPIYYADSIVLRMERMFSK